jgi:conjugative relaxase-like TrwC/TraI family protein
MLSLSNVAKGKAAASYYETVDDYYTGDCSPSRWWGTAAASLDLHGAVDPLVFAALLDGKLPSGDTLHHAAAGRRGGTDGTFSAPKSVSMQALIGKDSRILAAHHFAVDRALQYAETLIACRITQDGITRSERTGNLLVAQFDHDLSRACDPQLHTHCVMINATRRADGQWRASDNQAIYHHKMLLGALYRAELARKLQILGYTVRVTHIDGRFELAHINEDQIKAFSQRSLAIEVHLKKHHDLDRGEASAWKKNLATVITREKKTNVNRTVLYRKWDDLSASQDIDYRMPAPALNLNVKLDTAAIIVQAIAHVSERQAVFSQHSIVQAALERAVGVASLTEVEAALEVAIQLGQLIREGARYTTPEAQRMEREILAMEVRGRGRLLPIYQAESAALVAQMVGLSSGQQEAVRGMLLTANQVIGIQGRAGVGKTTLLSRASKVASACGYVVKGLAPSASAARELAGAGIDAETVTAFLHRKTNTLHANTLLILDEAGMTSTRQLHAVLRAAITTNCRVVLVGDTAQLQSVEAGKPFAQLQAHGMSTALVSQIQRQKNLLLKQAVELAVDGQTAMAVEILDKQITEVVSAAARFERIASDYVALPESERATTRVIAGTRYARGEINRHIRSQLGLKTCEQEFVLLDRKDQTAQQARSILSYEPGDMVRAETDYPSLGLKRGETAAVIARQDNYIVLERADGVHLSWKPALATKLTAYVPLVRTLAVGELVRVTANDRVRGLVNGDMARVKTIAAQEQRITICFDDGRTVELDGRRPLPLNYGYCSTVHASQGQTCDRVLIEADSHSLTANENTFYVAISRARYQAQIYTDDRELLPFVMSREIENKAVLDVKSLDLEIQ